MLCSSPWTHTFLLSLLAPNSDQFPGWQVHVPSASQCLQQPFCPKLWSKIAKSLPEQHKPKQISISPSADALLLRHFWRVPTTGPCSSKGLNVSNTQLFQNRGSPRHSLWNAGGTKGALTVQSCSRTQCWPHSRTELRPHFILFHFPRCQRQGL